MCILNNEAIVSGTQIFVSKDSTGKRQITIYKNTVRSMAPNAMILPV